MPDEKIKRPAYQWYVNDARGDEIFMRMSYEQRGIYRELLDHQWIEGSIPADPEALAVLLPKMTPARFKKLWPLISVKFQAADDSRLVNARLEAQRLALEAYVGIQAEKGKNGAQKRWHGHTSGHAPANAQAMPGDSSSSSTSSSTSTSTKNTERKSVNSAASAEPPSPAVLEFPTVGIQGEIWCLTEAQVREWQALFPSTDILAEARKALAWVRADLGRRKTARGMSRFLVGWLTRAVDHRGGVSSSGSLKTAGNDASLAQFVARHQGKPA